jgi:putative lipoprotein
MTREPSGDVPGAERRVRGQVVVPAGDPGERAAQVLIQVEDVSRADAPSRVVAERRIEDVPLDGRPLAFEVLVPDDDIDERGMYSIRVHVDVSGSGQVEAGDMITTQSYPVLTGGSPEEATVAVRRI